MTEEPTVLASLTLRIASIARQHGADVDAIFDDVGLTWEQLEVPDARIPMRTHIAMGERLIGELDETNIGLIVGETLNSEDMGMVGYILRNSASLDDFIDNMCRYFQLVSSAIGVTKVEQPGEVGLAFQPPDALTSTAVPSMGIVTSVTRIATQFLEREVSPVRVELMSKAAELPNEFFELIDCVVLDEAPRIAIIFDADDVRTKVSDADPVLRRHLAAYADQLIPEPSASYTARVRECLDADLANGPTIDSVATELAVSARTLQRRLAAEKTNFATVLEDARRERAIALLRHPERTVAEVAYAVGYADAATFSTRFKLWTGKSPSQFR